MAVVLSTSGVEFWRVRPHDGVSTRIIGITPLAALRTGSASEGGFSFLRGCTIIGGGGAAGAGPVAICLGTSSGDVIVLDFPDPGPQGRSPTGGVVGGGGVPSQASFVLRGHRAPVSAMATAATLGLVATADDDGEVGPMKGE